MDDRGPGKSHTFSFFSVFGGGAAAFAWQNRMSVEDCCCSIEGVLVVFNVKKNE
jgi:hypothetical protein